MGRFEFLGKDRMEIIDNKIDELSELYGCGWGLDYDSLCRDKDIKYFEHSNIIMPMTLKRLDDNHDSTSIGDNRDIFNFPFRIFQVKEHMLSHELAHILLEHSRFTPFYEEEADYFASRLSGLRIPEDRLSVIAYTDILDRKREMVDYYNMNDDEYNSLYISDLRKLAGSIRPLYPSDGSHIMDVSSSLVGF